MWVARPLTVWLCTLGSELESQGIEGAEMLVPMTFLVIIGTVVIQSLLSRPIVKVLGVGEPPPSGFLILGANSVSRLVARELVDAGFSVRLTDTNWDAVQEARMLTLFCISSQGRIRIANSAVALEPKAGETLISLIYADSPELTRPAQSKADKAEHEARFLQASWRMAHSREAGFTKNA
ncbi:hypothetical protein [Cobetia sp. ICG0124]|uniref:hypothetical protein n=1 Tax=Cobetia sp. ICG0124 TaxID=2053669 RepID=UPI001F0C2275|nr:hypothetical protein [Cobetia sp. ICG0124]